MSRIKSSFSRRFFAVAAVLLLSVELSGCGLAQVKPWERGLLAEKKMQLVPAAIEEMMDSHTYFSKEAASGGGGVGGGGCGCN